MQIVNRSIELETATGIEIYDITPQIKAIVKETGIQNGQALIFSRHTTTALAINEFEPRLMDDLKVYLRKLAPETGSYKHNDLHLRPNIPPDEPMNAHSHLMAMTLSTSEVIPIANGKLALGTYQSVMLFELDGPRKRSVFCQMWGEFKERRQLGVEQWRGR
ncbi:secondary thiamine-phosphate synthase enzyme YjbQ [Leptolyngbya ohadii]|uniref:secondary thiamine-phosphate synthase enzyme YjbQ n=1 Tax=Leptolyngbya ohadii TaxID=1962290 RepID=UPI000B599415|nr:secondary thiamine-phosphate synthase enzyme YjbQ [Leptolyngbya ohadii]